MVVVVVILVVAVVVVVVVTVVVVVVVVVAVVVVGRLVVATHFCLLHDSICCASPYGHCPLTQARARVVIPGLSVSEHVLEQLPHSPQAPHSPHGVHGTCSAVLPGQPPRPGIPLMQCRLRFCVPPQPIIINVNFGNGQDDNYLLDTVQQTVTNYSRSRHQHRFRSSSSCSQYYRHDGGSLIPNHNRTSIRTTRTIVHKRPLTMK